MEPRPDTETSPWASEVPAYSAPHSASTAWGRAEGAVAACAVDPYVLAGRQPASTQTGSITPPWPATPPPRDARTKPPPPCPPTARPTPPPRDGDAMPPPPPAYGRPHANCHPPPPQPYPPRDAYATSPPQQPLPQGGTHATSTPTTVPQPYQCEWCHSPCTCILMGRCTTCSLAFDLLEDMHETPRPAWLRHELAVMLGTLLRMMNRELCARGIQPRNP